MSSLIANKVKTNIRSFSFSLLQTLFMCPTVYDLYNVYNNNYNNNCLFNILLTQLFAILLTTVIFKPWLFCSHATSHKADCCLPFYGPHEQSNEPSWSRRFAFLPSRELYRDRLYMCILILVYSFFSHACC